MKSAASMTHALQLAAGSAPTDPVVLPDGTSIPMTNGYPNEDDIAGLIEDISDFTCAAGTCTLNSASGTCQVVYVDSAGNGIFPSITSDTSGC